MSTVVESMIKSTEDEWIMSKWGNTPLNVLDICVFNMSYAGTCECNGTPVPFSPMFRNVCHFLSLAAWGKLFI